MPGIGLQHSPKKIVTKCNPLQKRMGLTSSKLHGDVDILLCRLATLNEPHSLQQVWHQQTVHDEAGSVLRSSYSEHEHAANLTHNHVLTNALAKCCGPSPSVRSLKITFEGMIRAVRSLFRPDDLDKLLYQGQSRSRNSVGSITMTGTGLKKCRPPNRSSLVVAEAILATRVRQAQQVVRTYR